MTKRELLLALEAFAMDDEVWMARDCYVDWAHPIHAIEASGEEGDVAVLVPESSVTLETDIPNDDGLDG